MFLLQSFHPNEPEKMWKDRGGCLKLAGKKETPKRFSEGFAHSVAKSDQQSGFCVVLLGGVRLWRMVPTG